MVSESTMTTDSYNGWIQFKNKQLLELGLDAQDKETLVDMLVVLDAQIEALFRGEDTFKVKRMSDLVSFIKSGGHWGFNSKAAERIVKGDKDGAKPS